MSKAGQFCTTFGVAGGLFFIGVLFIATVARMVQTSGYEGVAYMSLMFALASVVLAFFGRLMQKMEVENED